MATRRNQSQQQIDKQVSPSAPVWQGEEYPRIDAGRQVVVITKIQGPEWVYAYRRWSLRLECRTVAEPGTVSAFANLGSNSAGPRVGKGKQSKYYRWWTMANDGPPQKGEPLHWNIFLGKWFLAEIEDCTRNSEGGEKDDREVYSRITEFIERVPAPHQPEFPLPAANRNQESINRESRNQAIRNQPIKVAMLGRH